MHSVPIFGLILVGVLWGVTNPYIKRGSSGVNRINESNRLIKIIKEISYLITNWRFLVPFVINQCGSVIYFFILKNTDLTLAVPVCNSLAFIFTALTGRYLGEENPNLTSNIGMLMIAVGIVCYLLV